MSEEKEEQDYHFFATSAFGWSTAPDPYHPIENVLARDKRMRKEALERGEEGLHIILIRVPLPPSSTYRIEWFTPQVEGVEKIWEGKI